MNDRVLKIELIPAIDLLDGKVVRLKTGDYNTVTSYSESVQNVAKYWLEQGANRLHVIDLDGAKAGRLVNAAALQQIISTTDLPIQFGGGVRSWDALENLFEMGVRMAIVGTAAVKDPDMMARALKFYKDRVILALDIRCDKVSVEGWLETASITTAELLSRLSDLGLARFIYTDITRDGTLQGPNLNGAVALCKQFPHMKCMIAGGLSSLEDLRSIKAQLKDAPNLEGIIAGKALYENKFTLMEAREILGEN